MKRFTLKSKHWGLVVLTVDDDDADLLRKHVWTCSGLNTPLVARKVAGIHTGLSHVITNAPSGHRVIHKNGCQLDFRKENLEIRAVKNAKAALA